MLGEMVGVEEVGGARSMWVCGCVALLLLLLLLRVPLGLWLVACGRWVRRAGAGPSSAQAWLSGRWPLCGAGGGAVLVLLIRHHSLLLALTLGAGRDVLVLDGRVGARRARASLPA